MDRQTNEYKSALLDELMFKLPQFCERYFLHIETKTTKNTCIGYAYDLLSFFGYIEQELKTNPTIELLDSLTSYDIDKYLHYITDYTDGNGVKHHNDIESKRRKVATLRSLYSFLYREHLVKNNPALMVETPRRREKVIVTLEADEAARLLDVIESGNGLTSKQKDFASKTKLRDVAIVTLLLSTGIRVSELVGIDTTDVDFDSATIKITRKGQKEQLIYMGEEAIKALRDYIECERPSLVENAYDNALFYSLKHKRMTARAVEYMVEKYSRLVTLKSISPHKLRSTYGTNLYNETGDIYLTASALGHKNVETTRAYYAKIDQNKLRNARNVVKIRED